jgi:hypothetical protein
MVSPHDEHVISSPLDKTMPEHLITLPQRQRNSNFDNGITSPRFSKRNHSLMTLANSGVRISQNCSNAKECTQAWEHHKEKRKPIQCILESCSRSLDRYGNSSSASPEGRLCSSRRLKTPFSLKPRNGDKPEQAGKTRFLSIKDSPNNLVDFASHSPNSYATEFLKSELGIQWIEV